MKKGIFKICFTLLVTGLLFSCFKDQDDQTSLLGSWIEIAPQAERTALYFKNESTLQIFRNNKKVQEHQYQLLENKLILIANDGEGENQEYFFEQINRDRIKVGDFYAPRDMDIAQFIIYEREQ